MKWKKKSCNEEMMKKSCGRNNVLYISVHCVQKIKTGREGETNL